MTTQEAWQKQVERMEFYRQSNPALITRTEKKKEKEIFKEIGIYNIPLDKPLGYIRLFPQDFIVEEKMNDGNVARVDEIKQNTAEKKNEKDNTLYANLIKIGIPTNVAVKRISECLKIDKNKIGYAGLKDADALTAQLVAFPGIRITAEEVMNQKIPSIHLANFYYSQGSLTPGDLEANIFTITIRTKEAIDEKFRIKIDTIAKFGVLNYFQSQRFGGLRLLSHKLGKLIMRGEYELAVKCFLLKSSSDDIPLIKELRKKAEKEYPDWKKIKNIFEELPYTFFNELKLLNYLINDPENYIGALIEISDQTQLWAYAYASWLFNKHLSAYAKANGCVSEKFPTILSDNPADWKLYGRYLEEDGTAEFRKNLYPFKFIQMRKRLTASRIFPKDIKYREFKGGVVINFTLPKGAYATTFLTNLFELEQSLPVPAGISLEEIDPKEKMGEGNIKEIKEIFKDCWYAKIENIV